MLLLLRMVLQHLLLVLLQALLRKLLRENGPTQADRLNQLHALLIGHQGHRLTHAHSTEAPCITAALPLARGCH